MQKNIPLVSLFLYIIYICCTISPVFAYKNSFFFNHEEGWFFYNEHFDEELEQNATLPKITQSPKPEQQPEQDQNATKPEGPPVLSALWIKENLEKYKLRAIDNPTPENVAAFLYIQRVMLDKSQRFSDEVRHVVQMDPLLDQNTRRPIAYYGGYLANRLALKKQKELLRKIAKQAGIFFFFQGGCSHCEIQAPNLKLLHDRYGFTIFPISLNGLPLKNNIFPDFLTDSGQAEALGVIKTPAMFLGHPASNTIIPLGQSTLAIDQLRERILVAARDAGWITKQEFNEARKVNFEMALDLTPDDIPQNLSEEELIEYLKEQYKKRAELYKMLY